MRTLLPILAVVALSACNGPTEPQSPDVVGYFTLMVVDGRPLPVATDSDHRRLLGRDLLINSDGSFDERVVTSEFINGQLIETSTVTSGAWTGAPHMLLLTRFSTAESIEAHVSGAWLEIIEDGRSYGFQLDPSAGGDRDRKMVLDLRASPR